MKPQRQFNGTVGEPSRDTGGPDMIERDIDEINKMFDPDATHTGGQQGGISIENLNFEPVEAEAGKGLSTNDFTNSYKNAVDSNTSARHTHSNKSVLDGITSALITAWNNAVTWVTANGSNVLSHLSDTVKHITSTERSTWNAKQNAISDLATIRSGAALGATAVQPAELADYVEEPPEEGTPGYVLATDGEGGRYWRDAGGKYAAQDEAPEDTDILWIDTDEEGTASSYNDLSDKPQIGGVELSGNKTLAALGAQAVISDLATIRTGAAAGATAVQSANVSHETWTFTYEDDTTVTKEVMLWTSQA